MNSAQLYRGRIKDGELGLESGSQICQPPAAAGLAALGIALALFAGIASPGEAAPFAYVSNSGDNSISVIDTATAKRIATISSGFFPGDRLPLIPFGVAVAPDGTHAYVTANTLALDTAVQVIDTERNKIVAIIPAGGDFAAGVSVAPDGKQAYAAIDGPVSSVLVIDTATNGAVAQVPLSAGATPGAVALSPDGKQLYVTNEFPDAVLVIDRAADSLVATIPVGGTPAWVAFTPDGRYAYVTRTSGIAVIDTAMRAVVKTIPVSGVDLAFAPGGEYAYVTQDKSVAVIATSASKVVARVPAGAAPSGVAVTPDGTYVYVTNQGSNMLSVIATATNKVLATIRAGKAPAAIGIIPPPPSIPFAAFSTSLEIRLGQKPGSDSFNFDASFILGKASNGINPFAEPVTIRAGSFTAAIPPGSFKGTGIYGPFEFSGVIGGVNLQVTIELARANRYAFHAAAQNVTLTGIRNPVPVTLTIGGDSGTATVYARFAPTVSQAKLE